MIRKWINSLRKRLPRPGHLKDTKVHRILGNTLFRPDLWRLKPQPMAVGIAIGLFIAFTPPAGIQMLMAAGLCMIFKGNIPLSMAATWVTNYFTNPFLYYICYRTGILVLGQQNLLPDSLKEWTHLKEYIRQNINLHNSLDMLWATIVGGLIVGTIAAFLGYWLVLWLSALERKSRFGVVLRERIARRKKLRHRRLGVKS